eukprot:TRINITY_DN25658_c0_g1_i2.p1 TRINITY_DN25658_c0_g1~~TRINITY_DN25658_c0_g1_i2.p1  ORF type:complete len:152 (-),score=37.38 TRINITY_DN25658_c0_g1_i2:549-1004(-)
MRREMHKGREKRREEREHACFAATSLDMRNSWTTWPVAGVPKNVASQLGPSARRLRQHWQSAYVRMDGDFDEDARAIATRLQKHWRGLWYCAQHGKAAAEVGALELRLEAENGIRGKEVWLFNAVALKFELGGVIAAVMMAYYDEDKHFVR